jgi:subtilisin family serine protease
MTDNDLHTSRRSTLKLVSGTAVGAAGVGTATATDDGGQDQGEASDDTSQWILRIDDSVADGGSVTPGDMKLAAEQAQQPVVTALQEMTPVTVKRQFWLANAILVETDEDPSTAKSNLSSLSNVREVHPNFEVEEPEPPERKDLVPQDHDEYTYGLEQINIPEVWETYDTQGEGVSVAVLDTGIDPDHEALDFDEDNWAFFDGDGNMVDRDPFDNNDHGTHVSGTVAGGRALSRDGEPHIGVAPEVELYNGKVLNDGGTFAQILAGMQWAVDNEVDVINMSLGATGYFSAYIEPVQNAHESGTLVVTSAGNSSEGSSGSPGNVYDSFSIGASNASGGIAGFSSGELVKKSEFSAFWLTEEWPLTYYVPDVSAPGVDTLSSVPGDDYALFSGTSMASPHTAGSAALMFSVNPDLTLEEAQEYFEMTARHGAGPDAGPGPRYGEGIIDVLAAITAANDGNVVGGTVTDSNGNPVAGATVSTSFGTAAETNENGNFQLYVGDGEWDITVDTFGYGAATESASVSGGETTSLDITLESEVAVSPLQPQPAVAGLGESFDIVVEVANLEELTVSLTDGSDLGASDLTLSVGETELTLGETFDFQSEVNGQAAISVSIADDASTGSFGLSHEFAGAGTSATVETGPTEVMQDPEPATFEIVDWGQTQELEVPGTLNEYCVVENTGDKAGTQAVAWYLGNPDGQNVFPSVVSLAGGESTEIPFPISVPGSFTGAELPHGWFTEDDQVQTVVTFLGARFGIAGVDAPAEINRGELLEVTATVQNVGNAEGEGEITYSFAETEMGTQTASGGVGATDTVTFEFDTRQVAAGEYQHSLSSPVNAAGPLPITVLNTAPPRLVGGIKPTDPDGDGRYEDIDGDGEVTMDDVQAFSQMLHSDKVQNNPQFFDFNNDGDVSVADLQMLFDEAMD